MAKKPETDVAVLQKATESPSTRGAVPTWTPEEITPEVAAQWLGDNIKNRPIQNSTVEAFKRDMLAGKWLFAGDPIRFNTKGELMDGQHRLTACVRAGLPFVAMVGRNLPDEIVEVIDTGRPRMPSDVLAMRGVPYAAIVAGAARWLIMLRTLAAMNKQQTRPVKVGKKVVNKPILFQPYRVTTQEVLQVLEDHPELPASCKLKRNPVGIRPSLLSAIHYAGYHLLGEQEKADAFKRVFVEGVAFYEDNDPALRLREVNVRNSEKQLFASSSKALMAGLYAWNNFVLERPIIVFRPPDFVQMHGLKPEMI
jgi:hypothetical protein